MEKVCSTFLEFQELLQEGLIDKEEFLQAKGALTEVMHTKCIHEKVHNVYIAVYIMYTMMYTKCIHFTFSALRIMYTFCMPILKPFLYT